MHQLRRAAVILFCAATLVPAQSRTSAPAQADARRLISAAIEALGGTRWAALRTSRLKGHKAAFFRGEPTGADVGVVILTALPDNERVEIGPRARVVRIYTAQRGWEVTWQGARPLSSETAAEHVRLRQHSLHAVLCRWGSDSGTLFTAPHRTVVANRLVDELTLLSPANESATLDFDASTHLPVRLSFRWRDAEFHDRNLDAVQFDNYHPVQGIETPYTVTRFHNGETVSQFFLESAEYNIPLPSSLFDVSRTAARLK